MTTKNRALLGVALLAALAGCAASDADRAASMSERERLSYALGMGQAELLQQYGLIVDAELYSQGLEDGLAGGQTRLAAREATALRGALQEVLRTRQEAMRQQLQQLAEKNREAGEAYRVGYAAREGAVTLPSGLLYSVLRDGDGEMPVAGDRVVVNYRGNLIDGTEFDSSYARRQPVTVALDAVIAGWNEALQRMPVGSKWELVLPPELGYGERPLGKRIGPNATLIFEVELLAIEGGTSGAANGEASSVERETNNDGAA